MRPNIIVVEDELLIAMDIKGVLAEEGYNAIINVTSVEQAVVVIEENNPILVLIDINLKQDKDGVALGKYLLEKDEIPYIYITSYADSMTLDRVKNTRPYGYIVKPFKSIDIKTTVAIVLNNYRHRNIDVIRTKSTLSDDTPFVIKKTIDYINDHISEKIEIAQLSELTQWQEQHFIRMFAKQIGITPYQYILEQKIEKSKGLLIETTLPIKDIAFDLGFSSYSNFCNAFKKTTLKTPDTFRRTHRNAESLRAISIE